LNNFLQNRDFIQFNLSLWSPIIQTPLSVIQFTWCESKDQVTWFRKIDVIGEGEYRGVQTASHNLKS